MKNDTFIMVCPKLDVLINELIELIKLKYEEEYIVQQIDEDIYFLHFEKFYFRTKSTLMISLVLKRLDKERIELRVISGGGKAGIEKIDLDSEASSIYKFVKQLFDIVERNDWSFEKIHENYLKLKRKSKKNFLKKLIGK